MSTMLDMLRRAEGLDELFLVETYDRGEPDAITRDSHWSVFGGWRQGHERSFYAPVFKWRKGSQWFFGKVEMHLKPQRNGAAFAFTDTMKEDEHAMLKDLVVMIRRSLAQGADEVLSCRSLTPPPPAAGQLEEGNSPQSSVLAIPAVSAQGPGYYDAPKQGAVSTESDHG